MPNRAPNPFPCAMAIVAAVGQTAARGEPTPVDDHDAYGVRRVPL